jgi:hypothetical protein
MVRGSNSGRSKRFFCLSKMSRLPLDLNHAPVQSRAVESELEGALGAVGVGKNVSTLALMSI